MAKIVVITGAAGGIGLATVLELARAGFEVIGTARTGQSAETVRRAAEDEGLKVRTVVCDVTDAGQTAEAFDRIAAMTGGGPWAVVNNAGFAQPGAVEDVGDELVREQLEVNLVAPARISRLVLPAMRERGDGRIVNISSMSGVITAPFLAWYCASKHGLEALSDALRMEVAGFGIKVVLIEPGSFGTGIWERALRTLPDAEKSAYAKAYRMIDEIQARAGQLPPPTPVARTVRKALESSRPHSRYIVGRDALAAIRLEGVVPTALKDYGKRLGMGLATPPSPLAGLLDRVVYRHG